MKLTVAILAALTIGYAVADCPNACSGNGECGTEHDFCTCYDGFTGADCSQRVCAMGLAYIDTPVGDLDNSNHLAGHSFPQWAEDGQWEAHPNGLYTVSADEAHFYMECSNRGKCDRSSGICQCFTGFEGAACNRTTCASGCSGHGTCETIEKFAPDYVHYELWDSKKTRMCQCDGGWGGIDCSMRLCKKNDDPLTRTTTREGYNKGLAEAGEVQLVDFRCPYNGKILNPKMRLVYTDVNFGDKYATEIFNPIDATTDEIEAALRALPNGVLADYSVDGVTAYSPLTSVERTELEADKFYQLKVTFASYLGDVPLLEVEPLYECQGGLEVDALAGDLKIADNVKATYIGDGPSEDLIYEVEFTAANQYTLVVMNGAGVALGAPMTGQTYTPGAPVVFDADGDFHPEAPKVSFEFSGTTPASNHDGTDGRKFILRVHTTPLVHVRNEQYTLTDLTSAVTTTLDGDVALNTVDIIQADESDWNMQLAFEPVGALDGTSDGWKFYLNGEFIAYVEEFTGAALSLVSGSTNVDSIIPAVITSQFTFDQTPTSQYTSQGVRALYTYEVPKEPVFTTATTKDPTHEVLEVTLQDNIAVREHLIVVLQITQISGSPDRYQWKVAGDPEWHSEADIPAAAARLDDVDNYANALDEEDPKRDVANLIIEWQNGVDNDKRKCAKNGQGALYYIQIGSNGLNDSPVCSDRGLCDYGTGECKCFKGYAGIDCSEQHALAGGAGGRSTAGL